MLANSAPLLRLCLRRLLLAAAAGGGASGVVAVVAAGTKEGVRGSDRICAFKAVQVAELCQAA